MCPESGWSEWRLGSEFNSEMNYLHTGKYCPIKVYTSVDTRFILEDFFAKLAIFARKLEGKEIPTIEGLSLITNLWGDKATKTLWNLSRRSCQPPADFVGRLTQAPLQLVLSRTAQSIWRMILRYEVKLGVPSSSTARIIWATPSACGTTVTSSKSSPSSLTFGGTLR
jgi:hypothetical protein